MRAFTNDGSGSLGLTEVDEPHPTGQESVVAVTAFSVNRGEVLKLRSDPHWRPGKDVAGTVLTAAEDGSGPPAGAAVVAHLEGGGWAERVAVPTDRVTVLPPAVDVAAAAALPLAGLTALRIVRITGSLAAKRVLVTGATGGVGHYFTELAAAQGALVTAVTRAAGRDDRLAELGAAETVVDVEQAADRYDVVIESIGGATFAAALRKLRADGLLMWIGQAGGVAPVLDFFDWTGGRSATIRKFLYSDDLTPVAADLATLVRLVDTARLHPEIGMRRNWTETPTVVSKLMTRRVRGKAVLEVTP